MGETAHVGRLGESDVLALAHTGFSRVGRSILGLRVCVYVEPFVLLARVGLNSFFCPAECRVDFLGGPTWAVGSVISSGGPGMVGRVHSCSEVRPDGC